MAAQAALNEQHVLRLTGWLDRAAALKCPRVLLRTPHAPPLCYDCATPTAARAVAAHRSAHVSGDRVGVFAQQYDSGYRMERETAVRREPENVTEVEPR